MWHQRFSRCTKNLRVATNVKVKSHTSRREEIVMQNCRLIYIFANCWRSFIVISNVLHFLLSLQIVDDIFMPAVIRCFECGRFDFGEAWMQRGASINYVESFFMIAIWILWVSKFIDFVAISIKVSKYLKCPQEDFDLSHLLIFKSHLLTSHMECRINSTINIGPQICPSAAGRTIISTLPTKDIFTFTKSLAELTRLSLVTHQRRHQPLDWLAN